MLKIIHTYIDFDKEVCDKDPRFKVGDHVRISKYKNIFAKGYTSNWSEEGFVINSQIDKKDVIKKMSQYFPKPYTPFEGDINVKVDLPNYATKADLKNATGVDTSKFAKKFDLASLKSNNTQDINKLKKCTN